MYGGRSLRPVFSNTVERKLFVVARSLSCERCDRKGGSSEHTEDTSWSEWRYESRPSDRRFRLELVDSESMKEIQGYWSDCTPFSCEFQTWEPSSISMLTMQNKGQWTTRGRLLQLETRKQAMTHRTPTDGEHRWISSKGEGR